MDGSREHFDAGGALGHSSGAVTDDLGPNLRAVGTFYAVAVAVKSVFFGSNFSNIQQLQTLVHMHIER